MKFILPFIFALMIGALTFGALFGLGIFIAGDIEALMQDDQDTWAGRVLIAGASIGIAFLAFTRVAGYLDGETSA